MGPVSSVNSLWLREGWVWTGTGLVRFLLTSEASHCSFMLYAQVAHDLSDFGHLFFLRRNAGQKQQQALQTALAGSNLRMFCCVVSGQHCHAPLYLNSTFSRITIRENICPYTWEIEKKNAAIIPPSQFANYCHVCILIPSLLT